MINAINEYTLTEMKLCIISVNTRLSKSPAKIIFRDATLEIQYTKSIRKDEKRSDIIYINDKHHLDL